MRIHPFLSLLVFGLPISTLFAAPALTYSTYLRQGFTPNAITTDSAGNIYIAGSFLVDSPARESTGLVVKLNPSGTTFLYQRYLGGSIYDSISAIAVDAAGNAYVAGQTGSPDFPVTTGGNMGIVPCGNSDRRSFVAKLDSVGNVVFSDLLGGSTVSAAQAVAVTAAGQVVVSGVTQSSGFPVTTGAYQATDSKGQPFLLELDPTGTKLAFSATGVGGTALTVDSAGNIYVAGTTTRLDYPTTPGVLQPTFPAFLACLGLCQISFQGPSQYVSKLNPTGSKLIFSTAVAGTYDSSNGGLAVDSSGNIYLTGYATAGYPYSVTLPKGPTLPPGLPAVSATPFLTKLDPLAQKVLFSVPIGGAGVQVDAAGHAYVGGTIGFTAGLGGSYDTGVPDALASLAAQCLPNSLTIFDSAYTAQVDAASGNILGAKSIEGSNLSMAAVALSGSTLWTTGLTQSPDVALTPNALTPDFTVPYYGVNLGSGSFLNAVDYSQPQPPTATPQIGCVLDAGGYTPAGPVARYQLLTIYGSGLGPATGVSAPDNSTSSLGGVSVSFGATPAILLYVSSTQINLAVPLVDSTVGSTTMLVQVNGAFAAPRQFALTYANPHYFVNLPESFSGSQPAFYPLAINADGSVNSLSNPAPIASTVSVFINGLVTNPNQISAPIQLLAENGWTVTKISNASPFVVRVDVTDANCGSSCNQSLVLDNIDGTPVAPAFGGRIYVK